MARSDRQVRLVEVEGYYHGVHFVPSAPAEGEITATFEREIHEVRHDAVDETKRLEAVVALSEGILPEATAHWERLRDETHGEPPEVAMPAFATQTALLAVAGETLLLAPVMDGFGIADPAWQAVTAATFVVVASGLLHLAMRRIQDRLNGGAGARQTDPFSSFATIALAMFALATTSILGWWRGGEMIFAAAAQGGEWAKFLGENATLTKVCVTLLTLGLPFFAAAAFEWGFARLRYAIEWRRARRRHAALVRTLESAKKHLQAVVEKRDHRIEALSQQKAAWVHAYLENYELGKRVGARRIAIWRVIIHIAAVLLTLAACCAAIEACLTQPITWARWLCYACSTLGFGGLYAYVALKAWDRPTPRQLYRQRPVLWRDSYAPVVDASRDSRTSGAAVTVTPLPSLTKGRI